MRSGGETGKLGEEIACKYLAAQGYEILHRNFRAGHLETDIICENEEYIVFAEVKTRRKTGARARYGSARDGVDAKKLARIKECAAEYLRAHKIGKKPRIDLLEVYIWREDSPEVKHIKNILG